MTTRYRSKAKSRREHPPCDDVSIHLEHLYYIVVDDVKKWYYCFGRKEKVSLEDFFRDKTKEVLRRLSHADEKQRYIFTAEDIPDGVIIRWARNV